MEKKRLYIHEVGAGNKKKRGGSNRVVDNRVVSKSDLVDTEALLISALGHNHQTMKSTN